MVLFLPVGLKNLVTLLLLGKTPSHNEFNGVLPPSYFDNFEAMMQGNSHSVTVDYV